MPEEISDSGEPYILITQPTPVYYKDPKRSWDDLEEIYGGANQNLRLDDFDQVDELQTSLMQGDIVKIIDTVRNNIVQIAIPGLEGEFFTDVRFLDLNKKVEAGVKRNLPPKEEIIAKLKSAIGYPYIWGGTSKEGFPRLLELYSPKGKLDPQVEAKWKGAGFDCSGLLYWAANRAIPRNTSGLIKFGEALNLPDQDVDKVAASLQPLDIIIWPGHVMIVLEDGELIESRLKKQGSTYKGEVRIRVLKEALEETMKIKTLSSELTDPETQFLIRRWYPV